jgi:hypothetical protein
MASVSSRCGVEGVIITDRVSTAFHVLLQRGRETVDAREKELKEIAKYQNPITLVNSKARHHPRLDL